MAFWGCSFIYDEIPSTEFDLILYEFGTNSGNPGKFATGATVVEEKVASQWKPFFYGAKYEDKLKIQLTFGVVPDRIDTHQYLSRQELESIAFWLTGHSGYRWLSIVQDDMMQIKYRCIATALEIVEFGLEPYGLKATFECDGPYAYLLEKTLVYPVDGTADIRIDNISTHHGFYLPKMQILLDPQSGETARDFKITNHSDGNRETLFSGLPSAVRTIRVDNEHQVIGFSSESINPYPYFNFKFLRLINGANELTVEGHGTLSMEFQYPVNVGS